MLYTFGQLKKWWQSRACAKRQSHRPRRWSLEPLEERRMLALVPQLVADINLGSIDSTPEQLTLVGNTLYFRADDGANGIELWKSSGTSAGTSLVANINLGGSGSPDGLTNVNGVLFFGANDGINGDALWKSDGTSAGTVLVKDLASISGGTQLLYLTNVNGTLFFSGNDGASGRELWKSDGTSSGTVRVQDIAVGSIGSNPQSLINVGGTLFFTANDGPSGIELWKSDGTQTGTVLVKDIFVGSPSAFDVMWSSFTNVGGTLFFRANAGPTGTELWKSDGTCAGTTLVRDINPGINGSFGILPGDMTNVGGILYFEANDGGSGYELWKSDGTSLGTAMVLDIYAGLTDSLPAYLTNVGGVLYFRALDDSHGAELWKSDGTSGGTQIVKDIQGGVVSSSPAYLTNVNGLLFFSADDGVNGIELWVSDGTNAGTVLIADLAAGGSAAPMELLNVNGTLFFSAFTNVTGRELWKVPTQVDVSLSVQGSPLAENSGAAMVVARLSSTSSQPVTVALGFSGTAALGVDYSASNNTIVVPAGQTAATITLTSLNDFIDEANESIVVDITGVVGGIENGSQQVTATILDDDPAPNVTLSLAGSPLAENGGVATLTATLSNPSVQDVIVTLNFSGAAVVDVDYTATSNTILVPAGQTSGTITLTGLDDLAIEGNESFVVDIVGVVAGSENGTQQVTGTVVDDDGTTVSLLLAGSPFAENSGLAKVTALLSSTSSVDVTVQLGFTGTATAGVDYSASAPQIVVPAGQISAAITLTGLDDLWREGNETVVVDITSVTGASENGMQQVTATISDDPADPFEMVMQILIVHGTPGNDIALFQQLSPTTGIVQIGSAVATYNVGPVNRIIFQPDGGNDVVYTILNIGTAETVQFQSGVMTATGVNLEVVVIDSETVIVYGDANDTQLLVGSASSDVYYGFPNASIMSNVNGLAITQGIPTATVMDVGGGGVDVAILIDSAGNDTFNGVVGNSTFSGPGFSINVQNYEQVYVFGSSGNDTANMADSAGDDVFYGLASFSAMAGPGFAYQAINFNTVRGNSSGMGTDIAVFYDTAGDDGFQGDVARSNLFGSNYSTEVNAFDIVYALALGGGNNGADITDSAGNDLLQAQGNTTTLFAAGAFIQLVGFNTVVAHSSAGSDQATYGNINFLLLLDGAWVTSGS